MGGGEPTDRRIEAGAVIGNIEIENFRGELDFASLVGDITSRTGSGEVTPGDITIRSSYSGTIQHRDAGIESGYEGKTRILGDFSGTFIVDRAFFGSIYIEGDLVCPGLIRPKYFVSRAQGDDPPNIHIHGSLKGQSCGSSPLIDLRADNNSRQELRGTIAIDGSLENAVNGPEIVVGEITGGARGAIAIDYDGWHEGDDWHAGATIEEWHGIALFATYSGNSPTASVYEIQPCKADVTNDCVLNAADVAARQVFFDDQLQGFVDEYPGLEGSLPYHLDCDFDGIYPSPAPFGRDESAFLRLVELQCCVVPSEETTCDGVVRPSFATCDGDIDGDFDVDLTDLATLLANFGRTDNPARNLGNLDNDTDVDLTDLATLLADFGSTCCPDSLPPPAPISATPIGVQPFDTAYFSDDGFAGEKTHYVFDVVVEYPGQGDDWIAGGVRAVACNGAAFRLVASPGNPPIPGSGTLNKYTTFFSVPYAVNSSSRFTMPFTTGGMSGRYTVEQGAFTYTTSTIDAAWYDMSASSTAPGGVFRLVIDVSGVNLDGFPSGFGAVYFSASGPSGGADVKVADMTFKLHHKHQDQGSTLLTGAFYATIVQ